MKKQFLLYPVIFISICGHAQQQFIHTATKANNSCNYDCTILDAPELNSNPDAIIWVAPAMEKELNANPHPIGVYYFKNQWHILNLDGKAIPDGAKFTVEYVARPDATHFQHVITKENLQGDGTSLIDHPALNNNPNAQFLFFLSWIPEIRSGVSNRDEISIQFNPQTGKWVVSNVNKKPLFPRVSYNIAVSSGGNAATIPDIVAPGTPIKDPKIIKKPVENVPVITKPTGPKKAVPKVYDFSNVQICIEKAKNNNLPPKTIIPQPVIPKIKPNGELEQVSTITQALSGVTDLMWTPGEVITVGFLSSAPFIFTSKVKQYVKEWETYANVTFNFITDVSLAKIKVGFENDGTSWSWIGRYVLVNPAGSPTMNFGWFTTNTKEVEFRRVILHEFGHALGFIHEHQASGAGIAWDKDKVYAYFGAAPNNWDSVTINNNIFFKFSKASTNSSTYDQLSIMHYYFPPELTSDGTTFPWNTNLSTTDKTFSRQVYPFPNIPPTSSGVLKTGDDCDEIEFTVEYNVVHPTEVEFILHPGYDHHNALVNWWKMIGIPNVFGDIYGLELYKTRKMKLNVIDKTRPITFGKAKILGVHTGLGFTWAPWPAIVGGCRVKFVWRRDSCN